MCLDIPLALTVYYVSMRAMSPAKLGSFATLASLLAASLLACSSESTGSGASGSSSGSSGDSGTAVSAADCKQRCGAKASACGAPADVATQLCDQQICGGSVTADQLTCLEGKDCDSLALAETIEEICPASGGSSGSSGGTEKCTEGKTTCNAAGDSTVKCATTSGGAPYTLVEKCQAGKCQDGECGYCTQKSECSGLSIASCKCKDGHTFGTSVDYDCISKQCQQTSSPNCASGCQDHGGVE